MSDVVSSQIENWESAIISKINKHINLSQDDLDTLVNGYYDYVVYSNGDFVDDTEKIALEVTICLICNRYFKIEWKHIYTDTDDYAIYNQPVEMTQNEYHEYIEQVNYNELMKIFEYNESYKRN